MKTCPVCHTKSEDNAKFCQECGTRFPEETLNQDKVVRIEEETQAPVEQVDLIQKEVVDETPATEPLEDEETVITEEVVESVEPKAEENQNTSDNPEKEGERWYYVDAGQTQGPFSKEEFVALISDGTVTPVTYIWKKGMPEWTRLKNTPIFTELGLTYEEDDDSSKAQEKKAVAATVIASTDAVSELTGAQAKTDDIPEIKENGKTVPEFKPEEDNIPLFDKNMKDPKKEEEEQKWYYVYRNRTIGPFSQEVMVRKIREGELDGETYVWREGYQDWKHLEDTPFVSYLGGYNPYGGGASFVDDYDRSRDNSSYSKPLYDEENFSNGPYDDAHPQFGRHPYYGDAGVNTRSIILYLLLTILTCGLFEVIWIYFTVSDINKLCQRRGIRPLLDPLLVVVLSFVTCGLYQVYYFWKAGQTLYRLSDGSSADNSVLLAVLGFFLSPAALAILQDQINGLVEDDVYR